MGQERRIEVTATNLGTKLTRRTKPHVVASAQAPVIVLVQEAIKMSLGHKEGLIRLEVKDAARGGAVLG